MKKFLLPLMFASLSVTNASAGDLWLLPEDRAIFNSCLQEFLTTSNALMMEDVTESLTFCNIIMNQDKLVGALECEAYNGFILSAKIKAIKSPIPVADSISTDACTTPVRVGKMEDIDILQTTCGDDDYLLSVKYQLDLLL